MAPQDMELENARNLCTLFVAAFLCSFLQKCRNETHDTGGVAGQRQRVKRTMLTAAGLQQAADLQRAYATTGFAPQ